MPNDPFLKTEEDIILSQIQELNKDLEAIQRLRKKYSTKTLSSDISINNIPNSSTPDVKIATDHITTYVPAEVPATYDNNILTWEERCVFILNELGRATVEDVIKKILQYEPDVAEKTARNVATNKLSKLFRQNKIKADVTKKRYIYFL
jgi:hypothetical protein